MTIRKHWDSPFFKLLEAFHRKSFCILLISRTVGPSVGGFLSRPEENIPGLTKKFPILREVGPKV